MTFVSRRGFLNGVAGLGLAFTAAQARALIETRGAGNGRRVLVLGAGMAGLAAGLKLAELGFDVRLLEARARRGPRPHPARAILGWPLRRGRGGPAARHASPHPGLC